MPAECLLSAPSETNCLTVSAFSLVRSRSLPNMAGACGRRGRIALRGYEGEHAAGTDRRRPSPLQPDELERVARDPEVTHPLREGPRIRGGEESDLVPLVGQIKAMIPYLSWGR